MWNWLKKIGTGFKWLVGKLGTVLETVDTIAQAALPVVETIAQLTPTRADDEIIRLFRQFALPRVEDWLKLPQDMRGAALIQAATTEMKRRFPGIPTEQIRAGVELALAVFRKQGIQPQE